MKLKQHNNLLVFKYIRVKQHPFLTDANPAQWPEGFWTIPFAEQGQVTVEENGSLLTAPNLYKVAQ